MGLEDCATTDYGSLCCLKTRFVAFQSLFQDGFWTGVRGLFEFRGQGFLFYFAQVTL